MNIVILDGETTNPGDISWESIEKLGDVTIYNNTAPDEIIERAENAEILVVNRVNIDEEIIKALPKLRYINTLGTGYNSIDIDAAKAHNISVCNVPLYCVQTVAQAVFAHILTLTNNVVPISNFVHGGEWDKAVKMNHGSHPFFELYGKTLGILGYGNIGKAVSNIAEAFGMNVIIYSRNKKKLPENRKQVDIETLFSQSDVLSIHCPLTSETKGLVSEHLISLMKPTAFLVNTARGAIIDEVALTNALNNGKIAGAGLDVLSSEPPQENNPLLTAKNCNITPHIAWASKEARERLILVVAENIEAFQNGNLKNNIT